MPHAPPRDVRVTETILTPTWKPLFDNYTIPHASLELHGNTSYTDTWVAHANHFSFLNNMLYLFKYQLAPQPTWL
jgi:hypothetical protein